jgi:hypothetical protein
MEYTFDPSGISLTIKEYKRMVDGDAFVRVGHLTGATSFYWDEQSMRFIRK